MICPKCQHENDNDSIFCINCGHQFDVTKRVI
ncbi:zinc-ribbon domain-containing protein [uncultured Methanobrevibacter sp.]|nr:zinc-ribbon domain-containing protein [uncultured Methanobrevibacter sp.]